MATPSLLVTAQPVDTFYKDEGGKSNFLTTTVVLPASYTGPALPLKMSLFFECGRRVEDQDQEILALLDYKYASAMVAPGRPCLIRFRLEKVSRRMDNQRFTMCVEVDYAKVNVHVPEAQRLAKVFTTPVSVLSKRKTGKRFVVRRNPSPQQRMKQFTDTLRSICAELGAKVDSLQAAVDRNTELVRQQSARLARLEGKVDGTGSSAMSSAAAVDAAMVTLDDGSAATGLDNETATMSFLSNILESGNFEGGNVTITRQTADVDMGAFVPPALRQSATKELIDGAAAASMAMAMTASAPLTCVAQKRPRAALAVVSPAGGSESGEDSPRPALPRVKLTDGTIRPVRTVPRIRRWRSMDTIAFRARSSQAARPAKRARA